MHYGIKIEMRLCKRINGTPVLTLLGEKNNTPIDSFAVRMRKTPKPYRVVLLEFRVKIFYSIKRWLTLAL